MSFSLRKFFRSFIPDSAVTVHETDDSVVAVLVIEKNAMRKDVNVDVMQAKLSKELTALAYEFCDTTTTGL